MKKRCEYSYAVEKKRKKNANREVFLESLQRLLEQDCIHWILVVNPVIHHPYTDSNILVVRTVFPMDGEIHGSKYYRA